MTKLEVAEQIDAAPYADNESQVHPNTDVMKKLVHAKVDTLVGSAIAEEPSYSDAKNDLVKTQDPIKKSEEAVTPPILEKQHAVTQAVAPPAHYTMNMEKEAKATLGFAAAGAAIAGVSAATLTGISTAIGTGSVVAAGIASASALTVAAFNGGFAFGSFYAGGLLHNVFWKRGGDGTRPGVMGTFLRGIVSPVTVPAGLIYSLAKKK